MGKRFLLVALSAFILSGCGNVVAPPQTDPSKAGSRSPCDDELYIALKGIPLQEMTDREYALFVEKDRACSDFRREDMETDPERDRNTIYWVTLGAASLVTIVALIIANGE